MSGGVGGEPLDAEQAADVVERGGDVHVQVGVDAASHDALIFYDGHRCPFLLSGQGVARSKPGRRSLRREAASTATRSTPPDRCRPVELWTSVDRCRYEENCCVSQLRSDRGPELLTVLSTASKPVDGDQVKHPSTSSLPVTERAAAARPGRKISCFVPVQPGLDVVTVVGPKDPLPRFKELDGHVLVARDPHGVGSAQEARPGTLLVVR